MRLGLFALIIVSCLTLSGSVAHATQRLAGMDDSAEISLLRQAYRTLAKADHDYAGHRVKAMKAIEAACDLLGEDIRGGGKGKERQPVSDDELRSALTIVQNVRNNAVQRDQEKIVDHLNDAIKQISFALEVK
jgi:hypothetical protein